MNLSDFFDKIKDNEGELRIDNPIEVDDINTLWKGFQEHIFIKFFQSDLDFGEKISGILPEKLLPDTSLSLYEFAYASGSEENSPYLLFSIGIDECNWELLPSFQKENESLIVLNSFILDVEYDGDSLEVTLTGTAELNDLSLKVSAEFPTGYFEVSLASGAVDQEICDTLFKEFNFEPAKVFGFENEDEKIAGHNLLIQISPTEDIYIISAGFRDLQIIGAKADIYARVSYVNKKFETALYTNFLFENDRTGKKINLSLGGNLSYQESNLEYSLYGIVSLKNYTLSDVIGSIAQAMGVENTIPAFPFSEIVNPELSELGLVIQMPQKHFTFNVELKNVFHISHDGKDIFSLDRLSLLIDYNPLNANKFSGHIEGILTLPGALKVFVSAENDAEGWRFAGELEEPWELSNLTKDLLGIPLPEKMLHLSLLENTEIAYHTKSGALLIKGFCDVSLDIPTGADDLKFNIKIKEVGFTRDENHQLYFVLKGSAALQKAGSDTGLEIGVELSYDKGYWNLNANLGSEEKTLEELVSGLFGVPKSKVQLPHLIGAQKPKNLGVFYEGETRSMGVKAEVSADDLGFNVEKSVFNLEINKGKAGLAVKANLELTNNSGEIYRFLIAFSKSASSTSFLATYRGHFSFEKVITLITGAGIDKMPKWLNPTMDGATFIVTKPSDGSPKRVLFSLKGNMEFSLKDLELVGKYLPGGKEKIDLKLMVASKPLGDSKTEEFKEVSALIKEVNLEDQLILPETGLGKGFDLTVAVSSETFTAINSDFSFSYQTDSEGKEQSKTEGDSKTSWKEVGKNFGPVSIQKFGYTVEEGRFKILVDGGLTMGGFTFSLMDLAVSVPLSLPFEPNKMEFGLSGLALKYSSTSLKLSGAFLHQKVLVPYGQSNIWVNGYFGEAFLSFQGKSFRALGAYINLPNAPSFFLYLVVNVPIGGPSYFYVNGFAVGFGINSSLKIPTVDTVRDFVLVKAAMGEQDFDKASPFENLRLIQQDILPMAGSYWIAVGLKVMHVKILQSFFLATVQFGNKLEITLLGLTKLTLPPPGNSIVQAELQMRAQYLPDEGFLSIEGRLSPNSFILSPKARLTGGFAFCAWFKGPHAGEFVLSMGGYHPRFRKPDHYPSVPRIGVNWQVTSNILIKGEEYYALTPGAFMAGGRLEASAKVGKIQATFTAEAHFMVNFSPFQYQGNIGVGLSASFHFLGKHTVHIGADVELWGPPFAGKAIVDLGLLDLEIEFGPAKTPPLPISWEEFSGKFLPEPDSTLSIDVGKGLIKEIANPSVNGSGLWIMNPNDFELNFESAIPIQTITLSNNEVAFSNQGNWEIGIAPMNVPSSAFKSIVHINIFKDGEEYIDDNIVIAKSAMLRSQPKALWGKFREENYQGSALTIKDTISGFQIVKTPKNPDKTKPVLISNLLWKHHLSEIKVDENVPLTTFEDYAQEHEKSTPGSPKAEYLKVLSSLFTTPPDVSSFEFDEFDNQLMEFGVYEKSMGTVINI
ncbi:MAG: hypothetical protein KDC24_01350 [Saprospiraceae bacterium]|nr:hypothetical protein [Saprospiraceae bacterium]